MTSQFIIYALCDPRFGEGDPDHVFYIGKSQSGELRTRIHATPASIRNDDRNNIKKAERIRELIALFPHNLHGYTVKVLEELPSPHKKASNEERHSNATALGMLERQYIRWARSIGWVLC